jgi:4-amino-4-deoxy-L-arabinose transferase-like glycosyltransferase
MNENTNVERRTSKVERRTSKVERRSEESSVTSTFNVRRSTFDVRLFFQLTAILLTGLFIYGFRLGDSPLDRTEPFRALVAHQMVKGGDWLIPRLYGEVYLRKPPLIYWIEASVEKAFGRGNEFVWRVPSAVGSALLAVFLAWWTGRWFGPRARLPAGFACLSLVALWDQNRGADIDALNTAFAVVSSVCVLELICGFQRWRIVWAVGLGLSLGATLLLKGPGGLPQVAGAIVGPAIFLRSWKIVRKPSIGIGLLIGFAMFAAYVVAAKIAMRNAGIVPDHTGWYEVIEKIFLHGWGRRLVALLMPLELLGFALPVSVVLPFAIGLVRKMPAADGGRSRAMAILGTLVATVVIWMLDGNDNPRYEYVMLPLLAPLVGFVWTSEIRLTKTFGQTLLAVGILLLGANLFVAGKIPASVPDHWLIVVEVILGVSAWVIWKLLRGKTPAAEAASPVVLVLLLVLFAIPMAERKNAERRRKSAKNPAVVLRQLIGNSARVSAAGVVRDLPELFYYANVDVDSYGEFGLPQLAAARGGHWVVISENEKYPAYSTIKKYIPGAFPRGITKLPMPDPRDVIYVGWYDPPANADTRIEWNVEKSVEPED